MYNVDIVETDKRDGTFRAMCDEDWLDIVSRDPEHDACHELTEAGYLDGPVTFWRDGKPSMTHSSLHAMGDRRMPLGEAFPHERKRRRAPPKFLKNTGQG